MRPVSMFDLERQLRPSPCRTGRSRRSCASGSSGRGDQLDLDRLRPGPGRSISNVDDVARLLVGELGDEVVDGVERRRRRRSRACRRGRAPRRPARTGAAGALLEAHELDDDLAGIDAGVVVAERPAGRRTGRPATTCASSAARSARRWVGVSRPYFSSRVRKSISGWALHGCRRGPSRLPPAAHHDEHRLLRLGDRDEVDVALAVRVDLGDALELAERHPVVDGLRRPRRRGRTGSPRHGDRVAVASTSLLATRLAGSSAVTPMASEGERWRARQRDRPQPVRSGARGGRCPPPAGGRGLTCRPACRSTISPFGWPGWPAWRSSRSCWPGGVRLPERSRNDHAASTETPRRVPYEVREAVARRTTPPAPLRRVWAVVASSGLALVIGAVLATVTAFSLAWIVTTLTDLLKQ